MSEQIKLTPEQFIDHLIRICKQNNVDLAVDNGCEAIHLERREWLDLLLIGTTDSLIHKPYPMTRAETSMLEAVCKALSESSPYHDLRIH